MFTDDSNAARLELNCTDTQLRAASITHSPRGSVFRCSCGPLSDNDVEAVQRAARDGIQVWLFFPISAVLLSKLTVEVVRPGWVTLEGFVVGIPQAGEQRTQLHATGR
jgi:hypothetical protein